MKREFVPTHTARYMFYVSVLVRNEEMKQAPRPIKIRRTAKFWRGKWERFDPLTGWEITNKGAFGHRPRKLILESIEPI